MNMIVLENIKKIYGKHTVIENCELQLKPKEHCALVGSSGSGKSTLLYLIGGLEKADKGRIIVNQQDYSQLNEDQLAKSRNENIGFIFQFHFLLATLTCWKNILLPIKIGNRSIKDYEEKIKDYAKYLSVEHCLNSFPYQLSGGEQQRINLIRAVIMRPKILLCDEPTGNLDSTNSKKVIDLLRNLANESGATLLVVTHDEKIASSFPRKLIIEDGRLIG